MSGIAVASVVEIDDVLNATDKRSSSRSRASTRYSESSPCVSCTEWADDLFITNDDMSGVGSEPGDASTAQLQAKAPQPKNAGASADGGAAISVWSPAFPATEYDSRLGRVRQKMVEQNVSCLVSTDPSNMNYVTGFDGWSFYMPQYLVITLDEVLLITRGMDAAAARATTYLDVDQQVVGYPDRLVQSHDWSCHPASEVLVPLIWVALSVFQCSLFDSK